MARNRATSSASSASTVREQELGSMYDYLVKIILIGPSGTGKSCIMHRFLKDEWKILSSQTIGVEFASKIVKVGTGSKKKRIKLQACVCHGDSMGTDTEQLWDTAGTERFRAVSRSYYRRAAGALLIYDITNHDSFRALTTFLDDARAYSPQLTVLLTGNKADLADDEDIGDEDASSVAESSVSVATTTPSSFDSRASWAPTVSQASLASTVSPGFGTRSRATVAPEGREVLSEEATRWASAQGIPMAVEVSALNGDNIDDVFTRLAGMILTKIELGEISPDDQSSGIQYGDTGGWGGLSDGASIKSTLTMEDGHTPRRRRARNATGWGSGLREWEQVFRLDGRRRNRCC